MHILAKRNWESNYGTLKPQDKLHLAPQPTIYSTNLSYVYALP